MGQICLLDEGGLNHAKIYCLAVEKASDHDSHALIPAIEDAHQRSLKPKTVLADTLYGGDANVQAAKEQRVEVIAPSRKAGKSDLSGFSFDPKGYVTSCPAGHRRLRVSYKKKTKRYSARFDLDQCTRCPRVDRCPVLPGKNNYYLRYSDKDHRLAMRRQQENSQEFVDTYRWRAGVEATMSQYDTLTGVKRLRVRGLKAVRYCATLKAAGLNIIRAAAVRKARRADNGHAPLILLPFPFVKERIYNFLARLGKFALPRPIATNDGYLLAA